MKIHNYRTFILMYLLHLMYTKTCDKYLYGQLGTLKWEKIVTVFPHRYYI